MNPYRDTKNTTVRQCDSCCFLELAQWRETCAPVRHSPIEGSDLWRGFLNAPVVPKKYPQPSLTGANPRLFSLK
jgi:hypothetical protein